MYYIQDLVDGAAKGPPRSAAMGSRNRKGRAVSIPHLLIHSRKDNVGVVVVEGLSAGTEMLCVVTEDDSDFQLTARQNAPIGHKIALTDLRKGDTILKYGEDIGRAIADIAKGEHVHVHNIKTKRW